MKKSTKKGFTIVELVIVIAVIGILAGVLIPTFSGVLSSAKESAALQEAKSGLDTVLVLTGGSMTYKTMFYVDNNNDSDDDYAFIYDNSKQSVADKNDQPKLYDNSTSDNETDDYYVVYVSKDAFVNSDPTSASAKLTAAAANFLLNTSITATSKYTADVAVAKTDDYFSVKLSNDKNYRIYFSNDINKSLVIYIAPASAANEDTSTPAARTVAITWAGAGVVNIANKPSSVTGDFTIAATGNNQIATLVITKTTGSETGDLADLNSAFTSATASVEIDFDKIPAGVTGITITVTTSANG